MRLTRETLGQAKNSFGAGPSEPHVTNVLPHCRSAEEIHSSTLLLAVELAKIWMCKMGTGTHTPKNETIQRLLSLGFDTCVAVFSSERGSTQKVQTRSTSAIVTRQIWNSVFIVVVADHLPILTRSGKQVVAMVSQAPQRRPLLLQSERGNVGRGPP